MIAEEKMYIDCPFHGSVPGQKRSDGLVLGQLYKKREFFK